MNPRTFTEEEKKAAWQAEDKARHQDQESRFKEIRQVLAAHQITKGLTPVKLREILEDLGPTYIKLGQIMSLHSDILPAEYCKELTKLSSEVAPMPFETVIDVIEGSYNAPWSDVFCHIDETPLGSASIAQVHRAQLQGGADVIVKVQRKGIYDVMARDIALLHRAARFAGPVAAVANMKDLVDLDMVLDEMWAVAQEEMDFIKEAANMEEFARCNADVSYVRTPRLYREHTTSRVLVMEYIDGCAINDKAALSAGGYDLDEIGRKYANSFIKQVMDDGFFHADPHPGNVKIADGKIVWIDMGMMGRLSEKDRRIMGKGVRGIAMHDINMVENAVLELGSAKGTPNKTRLYKDLRSFIDTYGSSSMGSVDIAAAMQALMDIMKNNRIALPHGMTMLGRGLAHVEGVLYEIAPETSMVDIAVARYTEEYAEQFDWKKELSSNGRNLYRSVSKGIEIPSLTADALKDLLKGNTQVRLELVNSEATSQVVFTAVRNLVIGVCVASLLMSSAIICTTNMQPQILGIPALGLAGFVGALLIAFFFSVRHIVRKKRLEEDGVI